VAYSDIKTSRLNTGRITFDGNLIKGFGTDSSDEEGLSTINLVPDFSKYGENQYLVLEPILADTSVHLRTAGEFDYDSPDFVLGAYKTNITLSDTDNNRVAIKARNIDGDASYSWAFTNAGATGFPRIDVDLETGGVTTVEAIQFANSNYKSVITGSVPVSGYPAEALIIQGQSHTGNAGGDVCVWAGASTLDAGNVLITAGTTSDETGSSEAGSVVLRGGDSVEGIGGDVTLFAGEGNDGSGKISIINSAYTWSFNNDGTTQFPSVSVDLHTGGSTSVEAIKFYDNSKKSVITGPTPAASTAAKPIIVQGQSQTAAAGGDVYIWAGDSTTDGGDIEILAGNNEGSAGYAGGITIQGGAFASGTGGSVAIVGGTGTTHGEVQITSNGRSWTFNNDGNITIPDVKDILDTSSNTLTSGGNRVVVYDSASGSVIATTGNIYLVDSATGPIGITLPSSATALVRPGYNFTVVDKTGHAATNNIQVVSHASDSIISAPSGVAIDTDFGVLSLKYMGDKSWAIMYGR
jgi:hypothetical protein